MWSAYPFGPEEVATSLPSALLSAAAAGCRLQNVDRLRRFSLGSARHSRRRRHCVSYTSGRVQGPGAVGTLLCPAPLYSRSMSVPPTGAASGQLRRDQDHRDTIPAKGALE